MIHTRQKELDKNFVIEIWKALTFPKRKEKGYE